MSETINNIGSKKEALIQRAHVHSFEALSSVLSASLAARTAVGTFGKKKRQFYRTRVPKNELFNAFVNAFPAEEQQVNRCDCCRRFLNDFGSLAFISSKEGEEGTVRSALWALSDEDLAKVDPYFVPSIKAMKDLVESKPVRDGFFFKDPVMGVDKKGGFTHINVANPNPLENLLYTPRQLAAEFREDYVMFSKFLGTADQRVLDDMVKFFRTDPKLALAESFRSKLEAVAELKRLRDSLTDPNRKTAVVWRAVVQMGKGVSHIGAGVIGKFYDAVTGGKSWNDAKNLFLAQTDTKDYLKPVAPPREGNLKRAEEIFEKLELAPALRRREACVRDIVTKIWEQPAAEVKAPAAGGSVFGHLKAQEDKPSASALPTINGGPITYARFREEILPNVAELFVVLSRHQAYNFCGLNIAADPEAKPMVKWDREDKRNSVTGYTYNGGSNPATWGLLKEDTKPVRVTHILPDCDRWVDTAEELAADPSMAHVWILEGAKDRYLSFIPLSGMQIRNELHEIRDTLQAFFNNGKNEPVAEGDVVIAGLGVGAIGGQGIGLNVVVNNKDGTKATYTIERSN